MKKKVYSASITPLMADGSLDIEGLNKIFQRNIRHGLDGIFILGTMGECSFFTDDFRDQMIEESVKAVDGRAELLVGITAPDLEHVLDNMKRASAYSFDSYVFMLPKADQEADPVHDITVVLDAADRPVYYYHCPQFNGCDLTLEQFKAIMSHPKLKGIKNSACNMWLRRELILLKKKMQVDTLLLEGQEWSADEALLIGCDGMLCGMGALGSKFMTGIAQAVDQDNVAEAVRKQNRFIELFHGVYGPNLETIWVGQKYAMKCLDLCATEKTLAQDMSALTEQRKREIETCVAEFRQELD